MSKRPADKRHRAIYLQFFSTNSLAEHLQRPDGRETVVRRWRRRRGRAGSWSIRCSFCSRGRSWRRRRRWRRRPSSPFEGKKKWSCREKSFFFASINSFFSCPFCTICLVRRQCMTETVLCPAAVATAAATEVFGYFFGLLFVVFPHVTWLPWPPPPPAAAVTAPPSASGRTRRCRRRPPS